MRQLKLFTALMLGFFLISLVVAVDVPRIAPYVNDFAGLMGSDEVLALNLLCDSIENTTGYEIAIVIVSNTGGEDTVQFANKIGDLNGVGKKDLDNGIVVLWSLDNEKGGAIATGRGSESILNDAKVGEIGRAARPLFDKGNYSEGFAQIVNDINAVIVLKQNGTAIVLGDTSSDDGSTLFLIAFGLMIGFMIIVGMIIRSSEGFEEGDDEVTYTRRKDGSGKYRYYNGTGRSYSSAAHAAAALALMNDNDDEDDDDSSSSGSRSGGSGFGSFGGGGFGGGGARF